MVDRSSSKRCVPIRIRLAVKVFSNVFFCLFYKKKKNKLRKTLRVKHGVSNLIGRELSCRER